MKTIFFIQPCSFATFTHIFTYLKGIIRSLVNYRGTHERFAVREIASLSCIKTKSNKEK